MVEPTGNEIFLDENDMIVSKTDAQGIITYGNSKFIEVSGYSEEELLKSCHNIIRHPNMPKAMFKMMWDYIQNDKNIMVVIKNMAKNGDHYWVTTDFNIIKDKDNVVQNYIAFRQAPSRDVIKIIEPIYEKMSEIEKAGSIDASTRYFEEFLKEKNMSYEEFVEDLAKPKGTAGVIFEKMKKLFS